MDAFCFPQISDESQNFSLHDTPSLKIIAVHFTNSGKMHLRDLDIPINPKEEYVMKHIRVVSVKKAAGAEIIPETIFLFLVNLFFSAFLKGY